MVSPSAVTYANDAINTLALQSKLSVKLSPILRNPSALLLTNYVVDNSTLLLSY